LPDDSGQRLTGLSGLHFDQVLGAVDLDLRIAVQLFDGACHCHFAVAAGHAGDGKVLVHEGLLEQIAIVAPRRNLGMMLSE
jgi:hypothetical protein